MSVIRGKNVITLINQAGIWKVLSCARSCTLDVVTEFVETTVSGSGKFKSFLPTVNSWTGQQEGVTFLNEVGKLSLADIRRMQLGHDRLQVRYERTADDGNTYFDTGYFYISQSSDTGTAGDFNSFSIAMQGDGALIQSSSTPSLCPIIHVINFAFDSVEIGWTASEGATKYFYKVTLQGDSEIIQQGETTTLSHLFSSLASDTAYTLYVFPFIAGAYLNSCAGFQVRTNVETNLFSGRWGYQLSDPSANMTAADYQYSRLFAKGGNAFIDFPDMVDETYFYFEYPDTEADYVFYDNGFIIKSDIPDQTFKIFEQGGKKHLVTRDRQTFQSKQIRFYR